MWKGQVARSHSEGKRDGDEARRDPGPSCRRGIHFLLCKSYPSYREEKGLKEARVWRVGDP